MEDSPESSDGGAGCCGCCPSLYTALAAENSSETEETSRPLPSLQLPADADHSRSPETPSSIVSLGAFVLSADYDAEREYVRHYAVGGYDTQCVAQQSQSVPFVMRDNSFNKSVVLQNRAVLDAAVTGLIVSPRELSRCLEHLALKIRLEQDLAKRAALIVEYEQYKDALDRNNSEDAESARYFLGDARNQRLELEARLGYYRKAVQFTNELKQKEVLRKEYHDFCSQLMRIAS